MAKERNSRIELLRIIACLLITFNHIYNKGVPKADIEASYNTFNAVLCTLFLQGGQYGCNIFLIVSAWFLVDRPANWRAAARVWVQTAFYTLVLDIVCALVFRVKLDRKDLLAVVFPLTMGTYWYSRAYVIMLLLGPVVRRLFDRFGRFRPALLLCGGLLFSILPTVTLEGTVFPALPHRQQIFDALTWAPLWFLYVYLLIYYVKSLCPALRDGGLRRLGVKAPAAGAILLYLGMFACTLALFIGSRSGRLPKGLHSGAVRQLTSAPCFASAFLLFVAALNMRPFESRRINRIATYAFGVYLFQCHKSFQKILWPRLLAFEKYFHAPAPMFALYCVFGVAVICLMGAAFEWLYRQAYRPISKGIPFLRE